jgi:hypothetical protein
MAIQTFTAGAVLTAAQMNTLQQQAVMTFTNEAARLAALPSPTEGMMAFLTAPTVPAATGEFTYLPSGIITVYNGTSWTCLTPVSAYTSTAGTTTSGTYGTLTGGGTNPSVTLTTGTRAMISFRVNGSGPGTAGFFFYSTSIAVSGATTLAASGNWSTNAGTSGLNPTNFGTTVIIDGLTAGTNTFTMQYSANSGTTGTFGSRQLIVAGML